MSFDSARVQGSPTRVEEIRIPRLPSPPPSLKAAAAINEPFNRMVQFDPMQAFVINAPIQAQGVVTPSSPQAFAEVPKDPLLLDLAFKIIGVARP